MYPLKFKKVFIEKVWGGSALEDVLKITLPKDKKIGESWEVSCHKNGMSIVDNGEFLGRTLQELLDLHKEKLVGEEVYSKYKNKFPILVKYLDVNDKLSVQVHPSDEYALKVEKEFGKSECWYIMEASSDAKLIMGLNENITKEEFLIKSKNKDFDNLFNIISVKKGDFINLKPGVVHATLEGFVLICEPQQNSDTTYRIYDFDRVVDGELRTLHLDKAVEVIDFQGKPEISTNESRNKILVNGGSLEKLVENQYFKVDKLNIQGIYSDEISNNFKVYSILEGNGKLIFDKKEYEINIGDSYFIPANLYIEISGNNLEILKTYI